MAAEMTREEYRQLMKDRIRSEAMVPKIRLLNDDLVCYNCRYRFAEDGENIEGAGGCYIYNKAKIDKPREVDMSDQTGKDDKSVCEYYMGFKPGEKITLKPKANDEQRKAVAAIDKEWTEEANKLGQEPYLEGGPKAFFELDKKYKKKVLKALKENM